MSNNTQGTKKFGSLSFKVNLLVAIMIIIVVTIMILISGLTSSENVNSELKDQCITGTNLLEYELSLDEVREMEDKTPLLERLKQITGCEYTIFEDDIRTFTTIVIDGQRVTGTPLDSQIANIVLNQGQTYVGEAMILGENHFTSYIPHYDENGNITGVVFAGLSASANDASISFALTISMFVGIFLILCVCIVTRVVITKTVAKPLVTVVDAAQNIANGKLNFDIDVNVNNEIGLLASEFTNMKGNLSNLNTTLVDLFSTIASGDWNVNPGDEKMYVGDWKQLHKSVDIMTTTVRSTLSQVSNSASQITSRVAQVSSGAMALAEGAVDQATSVDNLSNNLHEISVQVEDNSINTQKVNEIAVVSGEVTNSTLEDMSKMLKAMSEISTTSQDIGKVIKVIDDIAFQTNILALNAAVEAARAGEAGKGFAVVADEVRNLAQKSSEAAKNTTELIEQSINAVQLGEGIATKANASFEDLAQKVSEMVTTINQIAKATEEQAQGIKEISGEIEQISSVVQTNTATSEESAAASEELSSQADALHVLVDKFKL